MSKPAGVDISMLLFKPDNKIQKTFCNLAKVLEIKTRMTTLKSNNKKKNNKTFK